MKKIVILILLLLGIAYQAEAHVVSFDTFVSADDLTIERLQNNFNTIVTNLNSFPGDHLQSNTVSADVLTNNANPEKRWYDTFSGWVITGLLAPTSATLTSTTTSGRALIKNDDDVEMKYVEKDATSNTYTAGKWTYVDLNSAGTYTYQEVNQGAAAPSTSSNSLRLFRVSADDTSGVGAVLDLRVTAPTLGTNEDFYISGMEITTVSGDLTAVTVDAGVVYHGTSRLEKTSDTKLTFATATDWHDSVADSVEEWVYIGIKSDGALAFLGNNPPNRTDTDGNTAGTNLYWYDNTNYWRVISRVSMDSAQNLMTPFRQAGDTIYYYDEAPVLGGTASSFSEIDLTGVASAVDSEAFLLLSNDTGAKNNALRPAASDNSRTQYAVENTNPDYRFPVAWFPLNGGTAARAVDYMSISGGAVTVYVAGVKLSIR